MRHKWQVETARNAQIPLAQALKKAFRKASIGNKGCVSSCADRARLEESAVRSTKASMLRHHDSVMVT